MQLNRKQRNLQEGIMKIETSRTTAENNYWRSFEKICCLQLLHTRMKVNAPSLNEGLMNAGELFFPSLRNAPLICVLVTRGETINSWCVISGKVHRKNRNCSSLVIPRRKHTPKWVVEGCIGDRYVHGGALCVGGVIFWYLSNNFYPYWHSYLAAAGQECLNILPPRKWKRRYMIMHVIRFPCDGGCWHQLYRRR